MKPIINSRHGLPLIIFPGKVTQNGTLWNPANCIVCSQHGAGSCRALLGSREPCVPWPNNWSLQQGKEAAVREEPTAKASLPPTSLMDPGSDCWLIPLVSDVASQPSSQGRRLDERRAKLSGYQKEVSGYFSLETVGNCFVLICLFFFLINYYLFFNLEKKGRDNFGQKNPSLQPSSGTWRGMWLVISAVQEFSEGAAPFLN